MLLLTSVKLLDEQFGIISKFMSTGGGLVSDEVSVVLLLLPLLGLVVGTDANNTCSLATNSLGTQVAAYREASIEVGATRAATCRAGKVS